MTPEEYCQRKAAGSGSSFYYSFLFLPPERRRAITALYAFCREVDDVVDECPDPQLARAKLAWWRSELAATYAGRPSHPVTQSLAPATRSFNLPQELLAEVIDGMQMDLDQNRYLDFEGLGLYCHRVAGVVGWLALITLQTQAVIEALPIDYDVPPPPQPTRVPGSFGNAFPDPNKDG